MNNAKGTRKKGKELTGRNGTYISTYVFTTYVKMRADSKELACTIEEAHIPEKKECSMASRAKNYKSSAQTGCCSNYLE